MTKNTTKDENHDQEQKHKKNDYYDHEHNEGWCVQKKATNMIGNNCKNAKKNTDHDQEHKKR